MQIRYKIKNMTDKTINRFFSVQQAVYGTLLLICAIVWPVAHILKGTMNMLGAVFSISMLLGAIYLARLTWKDLRKDFKKGKLPNSK